MTTVPRRGTTLPELLIGLSITALLLGAVAAAYAASSAAVRVNDRYARGTHSARLALTQILTALRAANAAQIGAVANPTPDLVSASSLYFYDSGNHLRLYRVNNGALEYVPSGLDTGPAFTVASDVSSVTFKGELQTDATLGRRVVRVSVDIGIEDHDQPVHLAGSAVLRRALAP
jgi:Tfp pilus assembly protein PilW